MSHATCPASALTILEISGAMNPLSASSKSFVSENGILSRASRITFSVCLEGGLPLGLKCLSCSSDTML